jgi:hypothetical protein
MCRPLNSVNVRQFSDTKTLMKEMDKQLAELEAIALDTDFSNPAHAAQFSRNVIYLKAFYEHCERLTRGDK